MKSNYYLTILTIVFGFSIVNLFIENQIFGYLIIIISGICIISSRVAKIIEKIWFKLAFILNQIIPNTILLLIFYLILTPLSFLSKLFKADNNYASKNNKETQFVDIGKKFSKKSFKKAW